MTNPPHILYVFLFFSASSWIVGPFPIFLFSQPIQHPWHVPKAFHFENSITLKELEKVKGLNYVYGSNDPLFQYFDS